MLFIHFLLALFEMAIVYNLALAYIGESTPFSRNIIPSVVIAAAVFISKDFLRISSGYNMLILVITLLSCLYFIGKIDMLRSVIGALLSEITLAFGSFLLLYPILSKLGIVITFSTKGLNWIYICLIEAFIPLLVLIILRIKKISIL